MKARNINLDLLKVLACFAVVGLHVFRYDYNSTLISYLHFMSGYAVPVFFMVNGYLILNKNEVTYPYVFRKILNILLVVSLWNVLYWLGKLLWSHTLDNPVLMIIKSLLHKGDLWQFWFLGAMMITYCAAPLLHKLVHRHPRAYPVLLIVLGVFCTGLTIAHLLHGKRLIEGYIQTFWVWTWLFYFIFGGYAKHLIEWMKPKLPFRIHAAVCAALFVLFPLYQLYARDHINTNDYYIDPFGILNNITLFTCLMRLRCGDRLTKAVNLLAPLGMGCYIVHPLLLKVLRHFVGYTHVWLPFLIFPAVIAAAYGLTWVLRRFKVTKHLVNL